MARTIGSHPINRGSIPRSATKFPFSLLDLKGQQIHAGVSIGIAMHPEHAQQVDELIEKADQALYQAKK